MCPDCNSTNIKRIGQLPNCPIYAGAKLAAPIPGGTLYKCRVCSLKFRMPVPKAAERESLYDNSSTAAWSVEAQDRPDWRLAVDFIERNASAGSEVLDVGCYTGGFLRLLPAGTRKAGVEPNRHAARVASEAIGASVWSNLSQIPSDCKFDFIVATDVIEHVDSPANFTRAMFGLLKPEGCLVVTTGDGETALASAFGANWWYWYFAEHIAFVSIRWLRNFSAATGARVVLVNRFAYDDLSAAKRATHFIQTVAYGLFGSYYLGALKRLYRVLGRDWPVYPKGRGVTADHLMIVLKSPMSQT